MSSITRLTMVAILLVLPAHVVGQPDDEVPRLPWGAPDLQGIWLYGTSTPLERPGEFGDKAVVTAEEVADFVARRQDEGVTSGDWDLYAGLVNGRTSLLIDLPNGRLPSRTAAGQRQWDTLGLFNRDRVPKADGPEDLDPWERCIMGKSIPFFPRPWEQRMQIVQTPDHVAMQDEEGELRLIPGHRTGASPRVDYEVGWEVRADTGGATLLWSKRPTSTGSGRFMGPVPTCVSSSGSPAPPTGPSTTSLPSTTRRRLPARGPGRSYSLRIRVPSMRWPVTKGTAAYRLL